jgi:type II secretion system protein H
MTKMPTSVRGCFKQAARHATDRGFTLLELLVVLVIISVAMSVTAISLRPNTRGIVREEGVRLAALLVLASEESGTNGMPLAWVGNEQGYEFQTREITDQGPDWNLVRGDDMLRPRQLPTGVYIRSIQVDGQTIEFGRRIPLGDQFTHDVAVEIALGEDRVKVTGKGGRFETEAISENGT